MKLRLRHNSIRMRLSRSELESFKESGLAEDSVEFPSTPLVYILNSSDECKEIQASFNNGWITVNVPAAMGRKWAESDQVGIENKYRGISILIEKDWACLERRPGDEEENTDTFPRP